MKYVMTSESVTEGHPDKICDQISDAILDALLQQDPESRVAVETVTTTGLILVAGEVRTKGYVDIQKTARDTLRTIGYTDPKFGIDADDAGVLVSIHEQSPDIAQGVDAKGEKEMGAGDQGMMYGYATDETPELMPFPIVLAHKLTKKLAEVRKSDEIDYLGPDGKSQVTVEYEDGKMSRVDTVVISTQHKAHAQLSQIKEDIIDKVIQPVCGNLIDENTILHINPTGSFVIGGPEGDSGLTGRKIIVDTYGGIGRHGGGCFSGKDCSKVDRSGAYMARYVAKNIVAAGIAARCELQLSYAIGVTQPVSVYVDTFGTGNISEDKIVALIRKHFDLSPAGIIQTLDLKRPRFFKTAAYGHFGRDDPDFTWEKTDKKDVLKKDAGL